MANQEIHARVRLLSQDIADKYELRIGRCMKPIHESIEALICEFVAQAYEDAAALVEKKEPEGHTECYWYDDRFVVDIEDTLAKAAEEIRAMKDSLVAETVGK